MVGELLIVQDMRNICYWANLVVGAAVCLPFFLWALAKELLHLGHVRFAGLRWDETYFQRRQEILRSIKGFPDKKTKSGDGAKEETPNGPKRSASSVSPIYP